MKNNEQKKMEGKDVRGKIEKKKVTLQIFYDDIWEEMRKENHAYFFFFGGIEH